MSERCDLDRFDYLKLARSFADAAPKVPRKAPAAAVPRKSASAPKVSTQMSNKVAYPVFVTGGVIAGLAIWEVYRCRGGMVV